MLETVRRGAACHIGGYATEDNKLSKLIGWDD